MGILITMGIVIFILLLLTASSVKTIRPTQRGLVEQFGKYHKFAKPGINFILPGVQKLRKINVTERMADVKPQEIITLDKLNAIVDLVVYYKVRSDEESVKRSVYSVDSFREQIIMLSKTTARNVIGELNFEDVNSKRNELNVKLQKILDDESGKP